MRIRSVVLLFVAIGIRAAQLPAQARSSETRTQHVILVMTDGFRWQEVFGGAEDALLTRAAGNVADTMGLRRDFGRGSGAERRAALLPFIWGTMAVQGQLFGDSARGSVAQITNPLKFSYPGYSETFTGHVDPRIDSNEHPANTNVTVFEWLNRQPAFRGRVAAFATWDAFSRIINADRSGVPVADGWTRGGVTGTGTPREVLLRELFATTVRYWPDNNWDALTHQAAMDHLAVRKPHVLFIGYGETDEWAHAGRYDLYLRSVHQVDAYLAQLWAQVQSDPQYRDRTTLIVTTDHGRGDGPKWRDHGKDVVGAENIWMAVLGPDTPALGARSNIPVVRQAQVAATIAALLGTDWQAAEPRAAPPIPGVAPDRSIAPSTRP
ncbi:MAG: alkaline phosphatase family protein [Gemmatimonadaceae bacterium]|nr:alkaline phosphatase family protein [Gemmatimonadaceae bacterium]